MGYACPVCEHPQADAAHLANHLAITAIARGGAHERWLDETVPGWDSRSEAALAGALADRLEETETLVDDAGGPAGPAPPSAARSASADPAEANGQPPSRASDGALDAETRAALERARSLTRRRAARDETDSPDGA